MRLSFCFFFKQKTAYEMRISDWSSDVCSSDLYPLSAHGMMHTLIRNAHAGDPYRIDTLLMFMANMGWNSAMNTRETMQWLTDKDEDGGYRIPRIIYSDAFASEMVARSEERRVGNGWVRPCRTRWAPEQE